MARKLILFTGDNCVPCRRLKQVLLPVISSCSDLEYVEIDRDKRPDEVKKYNIQSIPTLLIFDDDKLITRKDGYSPQPTWLANLCDIVKGEKYEFDAE